MRKIKCFGIIVLIAIMLIMQTGCPQITTTPDVRVESVGIEPRELELFLDLTNSSKEYLLASIIYPTNASNKEVSWSCNENCLILRDNKDGTATVSVEKIESPYIIPSSIYIVVTTKDGGYTDRCTVTIHRSNNENPNESGGNVGDNNGDENTENPDNPTVNPDNPDNDKKEIPIEKIYLNESNISLEINQATYLYVIIEPKNATYQDLMWSSSDKKVVSVDEPEKGYITAHSVGEATITVATKDGKHTATCKVTVYDKNHDVDPNKPTNPDDPTVNPDNPTSPDDDSQTTRKISVSVSLSSTTLDISELGEPSISDKTATFTVLIGHTSYVWIVDDKPQDGTTENTFSIDTSTLSFGIHSILVIIDGKYSVEYILKINEE